jgi:hypothetical protein
MFIFGAYSYATGNQELKVVYLRSLLLRYRKPGLKGCLSSELTPTLQETRSEGLFIFGAYSYATGNQE